MSTGSRNLQANRAASRGDGPLSDVVVLVPGFMGFGRLGSLYYFSDRAAAALRGALELELDRRVPVACTHTDPAGCLASRQQFLLRGLQRIESELGGPVRAFHLVGHSTGGVDAELLTCKEPLEGNGASWAAHPRQRERIASVTTIAAPHYGTSLVDSDAAGWFYRPDGLHGGVEAAGLIGSLARLTLTRSLMRQGLEAALFAAPESTAFLWRFLSRRGLFEDLKPELMAERRRTHRPDPNVPVSVRCFVTATSPSPLPGTVRSCDGFFERLHRLTAECGRRRPPDETAGFVEMLRSWQGPLIRNPQAQLASFDAAMNDGIVDSARQLLTTHTSDGDPSGALAGIIVGDHGDVIGHYDRQQRLTAGSILNHGFFRSGSGFGDRQFFELWGHVARHIAAVAEGRTTVRTRKSADRL